MQLTLLFQCENLTLMSKKFTDPLRNKSRMSVTSSRTARRNENLNVDTALISCDIFYIDDSAEIFDIDDELLPIDNNA